MQKEKKACKKCSKKKYCIYIVSAMIIIFLSLPLICQEETLEIQESKNKSAALPLKTENPFVHYLSLLKDFYLPGKTNKPAQAFTGKDKALFAKNTSQAGNIYQGENPYNSEVRNSLALQQEAQNKNNYNYQNTAAPSVNTPEPAFINGDNLLLIQTEGLYETSRTDPYEVRREARRALFDIFTPLRRLTRLSSQKGEETLFDNDNFLLSAQNNLPSAANVNTGFYRQKGNSNYFQNNSAAIDRDSYDDGLLDAFNNPYGTMDKINLEGLPFEDQVNLVAGKLNTVRQTTQQTRENNKQNPDRPNPPFPPAPPKNTFNPTAWDKEVRTADSCSTEETPENAANAKNKEALDKIPFCQSEDLTPVNQNMQQKYKYLMVSGRYNTKIMIPEKNTLADAVLFFKIQDDKTFSSLYSPQELEGKNFDKNTQKTDFEFVKALDPKVFNQIMKDENIILLSVDEEDLKRYQDKTILIKDGEIETYSGANRIIKEINEFPAKQEQIRKEMKKQEKKEQIKKKLTLIQRITNFLF